MNNFNKSLVATAVLASIANSGYTQEQASGGIRKYTIEEVVVTARRVEESLQSTPISMSAFDKRALEERNMSDSMDLTQSVPGIFIGGTGATNQSNYTIRGLSKAASGPSQPGVVSYFAEVPDPVFVASPPQYDIESVQVLKGPQGTLFGKNTVGGAVLFTPVTPGYEMDGYLELSAGNENYQEIQGAVNIPIIADKLAVRLAGQIQDRDGYMKNRGIGEDMNALDVESHRVSVLFEPTEAIKNITIYDYFESDSNGDGAIATGIEPFANFMDFLGIRSGAQDYIDQRDWHEVDSSVESVDRAKRTSLINRTEIQLSDNVELINIYGLRKVDWLFYQNSDGLPSIITDGTGPGIPAGIPVDFIKAAAAQNIEQTSNEIQLRGSGLDENLDWLVGYFWLKSEPDGPASAQVGFGTPLVSSTQPPANYNFLTEESNAVFTHVKYNLSDMLDGLSISLGVRYTEDEFSSCTGTGVVSRSVTDVQPDDCKVGNPKIIRVANTEGDFAETTYQVGLEWQATDSLFTYLIHRTGYRAGGVNSPTFEHRLAKFQTFEPETIKDLEFGVRSDFSISDVLLRLNVSAFYGEVSDTYPALTGLTTRTGCNPADTPNNPAGISPDGDCDPTNDPAGGTLLANVGDTTISGVDLDGIAVVNEALSFNFGATYLDTKTSNLTTDPTLRAYLPGDKIQFSNTPRKTLTGGVRYGVDLPGNAGQLVANVNYYWSDDIVYNFSVLPSYEVTNVRFAINQLMGSNFDLSVFGKNIFDKEYLAAGTISGGSTGLKGGIPGAPRMYGASLNYSW